MGNPIRRRWRAAVALAVAVAVSTSAGLSPAAGLLLPVAASAATAPPGWPATQGATPIAAADSTPTVQVIGTVPSEVPATEAPFSIIVRITNPGLISITGLGLAVTRGAPITTETDLQSAFTTPPDAGNVVIAPVAVPGTLAPGAGTTVTIKTSTGSHLADGSSGLCLSPCNGNAGVYPVDVSLVAQANGTPVAVAHTFIPSFSAAPAPVDVSWVWPLLDRPHRGLSDAQFTDDTLATSLASGGRLDRALKVAELTKGRVRLTIVTDPELLDAIWTMGHGRYTVQTAGGVVLGKGTAAARAWLVRLRALVPFEDFSLTAYADPDVDALAEANQPVPLVSTAADHTSAVLGPTVSSDVVWPAGQALSSAGLDAVVADNASAILLDAGALSSGSAAAGTPTPDALAPLPTATGRADALVLDPRLQADALAVTGLGTSTPAAAQRLLAQLAVRAAQGPSSSHYVVLAPTRYVDPDPAATAAAMLSIPASRWGGDLSVTRALAVVTPVDHGSLTGSTTGSGQISPTQLALLTDAHTQVTSFRSCLDNAAAASELGAFPAAIARGESVGWRTAPSAGIRYAASVQAAVAAKVAGIVLAVPADASYTLASSDAPLYITVENKLRVNVSIQLSVEPANGEKAFRADPVGTQLVLAASASGPNRQRIKVTTHVARSGRFQIQVSLRTPTGQLLGHPLPLRIQSTALGAVALWITGTAFGVLVLALIIRFTRRIWRYRARSRVTA